MESKLSIGNSVKKWDTLKRDLPNKVAARCVSFFLESFKKEGWTDGSFQKWKARKAVKKGGKRNLLVKSGRLRRAVNMNSMVKIASWDLIRFEVDLPYANIHNEGFNGNESVKAHGRKVKTKVQVSSVRTGRKTTVKATVGEVQVKAHVRHMIMPKRKFMGDSKTLKKIIVDLIQSEIKKNVFP